MNITKEKSTLSIFTKNKEQLDKDLETIQNGQKILISEFDTIKYDFAKKAKFTLDDKDNFFQYFASKSAITIQKKLESITNISNYKHEVFWILKDSVNQHYTELQKHIEEIRNSLKNFLEMKINDFKYEFLANHKSIELRNISYTIEVYTQDLTDIINESNNVKFNEKKIIKIITENTKWYDGNKKKLEQINSTLMHEIRNHLDESFKKIKNQLRDEVAEHIEDRILRKLKTEITRTLNEQTKEIKSFLNDMKESDNLIQESKKKQEILEKQLSQIEEYQRKVIK